VEALHQGPDNRPATKPRSPIPASFIRAKAATATPTPSRPPAISPRPPGMRKSVRDAGRGCQAWRMGRQGGWAVCTGRWAICY